MKFNHLAMFIMLVSTTAMAVAPLNTTQNTPVDQNGNLTLQPDISSQSQKAPNTPGTTNPEAADTESTPAADSTDIVNQPDSTDTN